MLQRLCRSDGALQLLVVVLLALTAWTDAAPAKPVACSTTALTEPFCSNTRVKGPFIGDIHTDQGLQKALEARSWHREIILLLGSAGQQLIPLLQTIKDLELLGYAHVLPLAKDEATCTVIAKHIPSVGCAYSSFKLGLPQEVLAELRQSEAKVDLFHNKWRTAARAVQASYNVLLLDTDVLLFDDPYKYFKSLPLKSFQVLAQAHLESSEDEYRTTHLLDPGIVYIQNAPPSGAAAWLVAEMADRPLRLADSKFKPLVDLGLPRSCGLLQQEALNDVVAQAALGARLLSPEMLQCRRAGVAAPQSSVLSALKAQAEAMLGWAGRVQGDVSATLPPELQSAAGGAKTMLKWIDLTVPKHWAQGEAAGGGTGGAEAGAGTSASAAQRLYPETRGPASKAFRDQLTAACKAGGAAATGCTPWPDPGGGAAAAAGGAGEGGEKLALLPPWVAASYHIRGRTGHWSVLPGEEQPQQVLGHAQSSASFRSNHVIKSHIRMAAGVYHWDTVVHKVKGKGAYFGSKADSPDDVPGVVTVHPDLLSDPELTQQQYKTLLESTVQVAHYTRKAVAWPSVPCSLPWVLGSNDTGRPWKVNPEWIPHLGDGGGGVTPLELEHMKERYRLFRPMDPSPEKTLMAKGRANPDFTKRLTWKPVEEISFRDLATQVVNNLVLLPGSSYVTPTTHYRMHAVYLGQALRLTYDTSVPDHSMYRGDPPLYLKHLPDRPANELQQAFAALKSKCIDAPAVPAQAFTNSTSTA